MGHSEDLSPAKKALLERWARGEAKVVNNLTARIHPSGPVPLSFLQERQLFLELLNPLTTVNNISVCFQIEGLLDVERLAESANILLDRHEVLRTKFDIDNGRPIATITPNLKINLGIEELKQVENERFSIAFQMAELEAQEPFDVTQPPLLRVKTFRLSPKLHIMVVVVHHTIADGWSLGIFVRELLAVYQALVKGRSPSLPPLPIQYAEYASWQRQYMTGPLLERQLSYWKNKLHGELPVLDLPIDYPRPTRQTFSGAIHRFQISTKLTRCVKELSRHHDVTPFMFLIAVFQTLLHRYCQQDDILVGTPTAGRTRLETQELIGAFINTLVLRTDLSGDPSFQELLSRVRTVAMDAYAHQDLPFEKLVAELRLQRDLSRTPIFQVAFVFQNTPFPSMNVPGLNIKLLPIDRRAAQFDLSLIVNESKKGLEGAFEYNTDIFESSTIERMSSSFQSLLADAVNHPSKRLSMLAIMSENEQQRIVIKFNETSAYYPRDKCVHELFEAQVTRTPDNVAVICNSDQLTYRDLDAWANKVALDLEHSGVGPDARVGVHMERSLELVVSLLAVLKAGGAYVPIDTSCPIERAEYMLNDASASVILYREPVTSFGTIKALLVNRPNDLELSHWREKPAHNRRMSSTNLAYVMYTSGSTGQPKGVLVPNRALVNLLWSMRELLKLKTGQALLAITSVSFDISALELFLPLISGATVVLATRDMTTDRSKLEDAIAQPRVKAMQATPATWRMMLKGPWPGDPNLVALCGGEPLTPELADKLLNRVGVLWNMYGPTETTVWSAAGKIRRAQSPITVERPIANTQLYVLDQYLQPVPIGVSGELHIGGDGVALGYLNQPELTAERFISDPFSKDVGEKMKLYKTGDRARRLSDGSIELLGRLDDQVKIQGFRIEPGEIEAALSRHPSVEGVAVVTRESSEGNKILVAYFVSVKESIPAPGELRNYLRSLLPAYMVPAVFVSLPDLPITIAGKIDRHALQKMVSPSTPHTFTPPRSSLEEQLSETYAQVLGVDHVGIHDNFFDLGGGSIQILEIIVQIQTYDITLIPEWFFEYQTVAELASFLSDTQ